MPCILCTLLTYATYDLLLNIFNIDVGDAILYGDVFAIMTTTICGHQSPLTFKISVGQQHL